LKFAPILKLERELIYEIINFSAFNLCKAFHSVPRQKRKGNFFLTRQLKGKVFAKEKPKSGQVDVWHFVHIVKKELDI
jgi:hypothetical protein